jgi:hypothetical protein
VHRVGDILRTVHFHRELRWTRPETAVPFDDVTTCRNTCTGKNCSHKQMCQSAVQENLPSFLTLIRELRANRRGASDCR